MRLWILGVIAATWLLALAYYGESGGMECNDSCSVGQGLAGIAVVALPVVFVVVLIVVIFGSASRRLNR